MPQTKKKVTLIGTVHAEVGREFVYDGPAAACADCSLFRACANLDTGKRYVVVAKRPTRHPCRVHLDGVCAVDVELAPIYALVSSDQARQHTTITFRHPCSAEECPRYAACNPEGILVGQKYIVIDRLNEEYSGCIEGGTRALVKLIPLPDELPSLSV